MIFGDVFNERLQLNEKSLWSGRHEDFVNPEAKKALPFVRKLLFEGKYAEAQKTAQEDDGKQKKVLGSYQTLGDLHLNLKINRLTNNTGETSISKPQSRRFLTDRANVNYRREIFPVRLITH